MTKETPEFKPSSLEIWSSVFLMALMLAVNFYTSWGAYSLGASASFHITHGISASWLGITGSGVSVLAAILAWRGFGLNAIAGFLVSASLAATIANNDSYQTSVSTFVAVMWLVAAIWSSRKFFEHNPFQTFLALWGMTFLSSVSQSIIYKFVFNHSYPLTGVLLLKLVLFGLGGLTVMFTHPRKNEEYVI